MSVVEIVKELNRMKKKSSKDRKKREKLSSKDYSQEQKQDQKEYLEGSLGICQEINHAALSGLLSNTDDERMTSNHQQPREMQDNNNRKLLKRQDKLEGQDQDVSLSKDVQYPNARSELLSSLTTKSGEKLPTHVVIDCSMFSYVDTAGITQLKSTIKDYESIGVKTYLAGIATHVDQLLEIDNFYKEVPPHHVYITIQDAVHHAQQDQLGYDFDDEDMQEQQSHHEEENDDETTSCLH